MEFSKTPLEAAAEAVFCKLDPRESDGLHPDDAKAIVALCDQDKAALEAKILERVAPAGEVEYRQLQALELVGSVRVVPLLRRTFAAADRKHFDWGDLELAVAIWRTDKDEGMLDYALAELSGLLVTRRIAAARALRGAPCPKAAEALRRVVLGDGDVRLRFEALRSLTEQRGIDLGIPLEDSILHYHVEALEALIAKLGLRAGP